MNCYGFSFKEFDIDNFQDSFLGDFESPRDYAKSIFEESVESANLPDLVRWNIDWDGIVNDLKCGGTYFHEYRYWDGDGNYHSGVYVFE